MPPARSHDEYTLSIRLAEIEPAIWRRIVVPGQLTLHQLHQVLQVTMGWTHSHLHQFIVPGTNESTYYGEPSPGGPAQPPETNPTDHQVTPASYALVPRLPQPSKPPLLSRSKRVAV